VKQFMKKSELADYLGVSPAEADRIGEASGAKLYSQGLRCFVYDVDKAKSLVLADGSKKSIREDKSKGYMLSQSNRSKAQERSADAMERDKLGPDPFVALRSLKAQFEKRGKKAPRLWSYTEPPRYQ